MLTGSGLSAMMPQPGDPRPTEERPHLTVALDKGSDGFSAVWALINKFRLRLTPLFDPMHIPWRDLDMWMDAYSVKTSMILRTVSHNLEFGPWDGESWACQLRETAAEIAAMCDIADPALWYWWPRIAEELNLTAEEEADTDLAKLEFLRGVPSSHWLHRKGPRVATCRWGTFCEAEQYKSSHEAQRAFAFTWQGLLQGWLTKTTCKSVVAGGMLTQVPAEVEQKGASKQTTKQSRAEVSKIRDRSNNSARLSLFIHMDPKVQRDVGLLTYVLKPVRHYQAKLCASLKSLDASLSCYTNIASMADDFMQILGSMLKPFSKLDDLRRIGFTTDIHSSLLAISRTTTRSCFWRRRSRTTCGAASWARSRTFSGGTSRAPSPTQASLRCSCRLARRRWRRLCGSSRPTMRDSSRRPSAPGRSRTRCCPSRRTIGWS